MPNPLIQGKSRRRILRMCHLGFRTGPPAGTRRQPVPGPANTVPDRPAGFKPVRVTRGNYPGVQKNSGNRALLAIASARLDAVFPIERGTLEALHSGGPLD
ncbi:hypothetical protein B0H13DRAFT_1880578 [Mycena leptocephala]|nr:hypothetical protein B0H13DRAFT_1880578 [Mycena leptocephala]